MKTDEIRRILWSMESGECRYVLEPRVQVYCHAPLVMTPPDPDGRTGWRRGPRWYRVLCPGVYDYSADELFADPAPWFDEDTAFAQIVRSLAAPAVGPEHRSRWTWEDHKARYPIAGAPARSQPEPDSQPATIPMRAPSPQPTQRRLFA